MKLPEFTAEASISVIKKNYRFGWNGTSSKLELVPAMRPREGRCYCGGYTGADGDWHIACYCFD